MEALSEWLATELHRRDWSMSRLGREAGYSSTQISNVINGTAPATADFTIRVAKALGENPVLLLHMAGHLPAAPPPTDLDHIVADTFRQLSDTQRNAIAAIVCELAGTPMEHAPAIGASPPAQRLAEKVDGMGLWGDICTEMEYCGLLLLEDWTDRGTIERHYLLLQTALVNLLWTLMEPSDHPGVDSYARRLLNAYRRHQVNHRGESEEAKTSST